MCIPFDTCHIHRPNKTLQAAFIWCMMIPSHPYHTYPSPPTAWKRVVWCGFLVLATRGLGRAGLQMEPFVEGFLSQCMLACSITQSCPTLCDPMNCNSPGSSVHGNLQTRIPEWVAMPSSRGSCWPKDWTPVSPGLQVDSFTAESLGKPLHKAYICQIITLYTSNILQPF